MKFLKPFLALVCGLCFCIEALCQCHFYELRGKLSNMNNGMVYLVPAIPDPGYYGFHVMPIDSGVVANNSFILERRTRINAILPYILVFRGDSNGSTGMILLSPDNQTLSIDIIDEFKTPSITGSPYQAEMKNYFDSYFGGLVRQIRILDSYSLNLLKKYGGVLPIEEGDSLREESKVLQMKGDTLFSNYAYSHRGSYVTLWKLIERFKANGFNETYSNIFYSLDRNLRTSLAGKLLGKELERDKVLAIGSIFPAMKVKNVSFKDEKLHFNTHGDKTYTLIDFWFTSCVPCLNQFPGMKTLLRKYAPWGFQIIGISVDNEADKNKWAGVLKKDGLHWPNFLDVSGRFAARFNINSFPSNFLLNGRGQIIMRNVTPSQLKSFLAANLRIYDNLRILNEPL